MNHSICYLLFYSSKTMIKYILIIISVFLLSWCNNTPKNETKEITFWNYKVYVNKNYKLVNIKTTNIWKNIKIISEYKLSNNTNNFNPSFVIYQYNWEYPKNINKFTNIILNKLKKNIKWVYYLDNNFIDIWKSKLFYFSYSVYNNLFKKEKTADYYWLQAYIFDQSKKNIYIISYINKTKDNLNNMINKIKDLKLNK